MRFQELNDFLEVSQKNLPDGIKLFSTSFGFPPKRTFVFPMNSKSKDFSAYLYTEKEDKGDVKNFKKEIIFAPEHKDLGKHLEDSIQVLQVDVAKVIP